MRNLILLLAALHCVQSQTAQPQCQCIPPPGGAQPCLPYDSRFQAATLEEAMTSFPDLSLDQQEPGQVTTLASQVTCQTQECLDCQKDLRHKLEQVGLMPAAIDGAIQAQGASMSTCKKYRFARKDEGVYNKRSVDHVYEDDDSSSSEEDERKKRKRERKEKKRESRHRDKRQMPPSTIDPTSGQTIIGERFILSCTSKGVTTDATGTVSLCSSCWMWRRLPNNYSPQYINELICDTSDRNCLSGYATCGVGHRTIEVIRNDTGVMTTVALSAGSYCECRVAANSAIQSLVSGAGLGTSLPAINSTAGSN